VITANLPPLTSPPRATSLAPLGGAGTPNSREYPQYQQQQQQYHGQSLSAGSVLTPPPLGAPAPAGTNQAHRPGSGMGKVLLTRVGVLLISISTRICSHYSPALQHHSLYCTILLMLCRYSPCVILSARVPTVHIRSIIIRVHEQPQRHVGDR